MFEQISAPGTPSMVPSLLTPVEAARFLRVHEKTAIRMARQHSLPAIRLGKHWRFRMEDLTRWAADQVQWQSQPAE